RRVQRETAAFARDEGGGRACWSPNWVRTVTIAAPRSSPLCRYRLRCRYQTVVQDPEEAAPQAVENDVHIVGVATHAPGPQTLAPALIEPLKREGAGDILVVVGGVIPPKDYDFLKKAGVSAIYGPGTNIPQAAAEILSLIRNHRLAA